MKPDKPANSFSADLAGLPPVSSDTLAAAVASAAAAVGCGAQVVPHMPASNLTPTPTAQPGHLTPDALAELELARQRAARAAAGRRQQLIAQKRAKEQAHQEALAAAADKRRRTASAPAPASAMTMQSSGDDSDADEGQMASTGDPIKDSRRLKRLLRNRVSAQQARERKKQHMNDLEEQVHAQAERIEQLTKELAAAQSEADTLRLIISNMRGADASPVPAHGHDNGSGGLAGSDSAGMAADLAGSQQPGAAADSKPAASKHGRASKQAIAAAATAAAARPSRAPPPSLARCSTSNAAAARQPPTKAFQLDQHTGSVAGTARPPAQGTEALRSSFASPGSQQLACSWPLHPPTAMKAAVTVPPTPPQQQPQPLQRSSHMMLSPNCSLRDPGSTDPPHQASCVKPGLHVAGASGTNLTGLSGPGSGEQAGTRPWWPALPASQPLPGPHANLQPGMPNACFSSDMAWQPTIFSSSNTTQCKPSALAQAFSTSARQDAPPLAPPHACMLTPQWSAAAVHPGNCTTHPPAPSAPAPAPAEALAAMAPLTTPGPNPPALRGWATDNSSTEHSLVAQPSLFRHLERSCELVSSRHGSSGLLEGSLVALEAPPSSSHSAMDLQAYEEQSPVPTNIPDSHVPGLASVAFPHAYDGPEPRMGYGFSGAGKFSAADTAVAHNQSAPHASPGHGLAPNPLMFAALQTMVAGFDMYEGCELGGHGLEELGALGGQEEGVGHGQLAELGGAEGLGCEVMCGQRSAELPHCQGSSDQDACVGQEEDGLVVPQAPASCCFSPR
ncbi:hypothetical protein QJQ45_005564 [Haematococcus lacustris]|nr:hypothetical protein QJQ45_005564 [Haematococcus lacustris]